MRFLACAVVAISMLAGAAQAGEWRLTAISSASAYLVDMSTIRNVPYTRKKVAWTAQLLPVTSVEGNDYYITQYEFDCDEVTFADLSFHEYGVGRKHPKSNNMRLSAKPVIPDTNAHSFHRGLRWFRCFDF